MAIPRRLCETVVKTAAPGPGRVDDQAVEDLAVLLVGVEALIYEVAQEPPRLGDADADPVLGGEQTGRVVLGVRHHVSDGGETQSDDSWIDRPVDQLVDHAGHEAGVRANRQVLDPELVDVRREPPVRSRNDVAAPFATVANGEYVVGAERIRYGICDVIAVADPQHARRLFDHPIGAHQTFDRGAIIRGQRDAEAQPPFAQRDVVLPADPDDREPQAHQ